MEPMLLSEIASAVGAEMTAKDQIIREISTDSRAITQGCLFFAIEGENFDGHDFVEQAFRDGAAAAIVSRAEKGGTLLVVGDTKKALIDLAGHYRKKFSIPVVGVTGSVGKTTTKELTAVVLSQKFNTLKTQGNKNNEIGLPLTLFEITTKTEAAVIEMGMSGLGEISILSHTAKPTVAIITNIGVSHIETLGSRDNILKAKLEIVDGMDSNGIMILNSDDDKLSGVSELKLGHKIIRCAISNEEADIKAENVRQLYGGMKFDIIYGGAAYAAFVPSIGSHIVTDSLVAFAAGIICGIEPEDCATGLSKYSPSGMRQRVVEYKNYIIIEDCYNASPDSMKASLSALISMPNMGRKIAVLGDMLELGHISDISHFQIGEFAAESGVEILMICGAKKRFTERGATSKGLKDVRMFESKEELAQNLKNELKSGDAVLVKASRGMKFEEILKLLYRES